MGRRNQKEMGRRNRIPAATTPAPAIPAGHQDQPPTSQDEQPIVHFLHAHPFRRTLLPAGYPSPVCTGCEKPCPATEPVYSCTLCPSVTLDATCFTAPRITTHRAHLGHTLALLATPPYPTRSFRCDACGENGRAFCYRCTQCTDFDLHVACAQAPAKVKVPEHGDELDLVFGNASGPLASLGFRCDVCGGVGVAGTWRYRCEPCDFDAHIGCALDSIQVQRGQTQQGLLQSQAQCLPQQKTTVGVRQQAPPLRAKQPNMYQHQAPWSSESGSSQQQIPWHSGPSQNQHPVRPQWFSGSHNQQPVPSPPIMSQQQLGVEDPYAQILNHRKEETEKIVAYMKAQSEMQNRLALEILQSYQRPSPRLAGQGVVGGFGATTSPSPFYPYQSSGGGATPSFDELLQGFSNISLGNNGGSGGSGFGGSATYPSGDGAGGADQLSVLLSQITGQQSQGGNFAVPSSLTNLLGGSGTAGGIDWGSIMSMFFS